MFDNARNLLSCFKSDDYCVTGVKNEGQVTKCLKNDNVQVSLQTLITLMHLCSINYTHDQVHKYFLNIMKSFAANIQVPIKVFSKGLL